MNETVKANLINSSISGVNITIIGQSGTILYQDSKGNEIETPERLSGNIGAAYSSEAKAILGFSYASVTGNPTGKFSSEAQTITYIYTKNLQPAQSVKVFYQDDKGNIIADAVNLEWQPFF